MKKILILLFVLVIYDVSHSKDMVHILGYHTFIGGNRSKYDFSTDELRSHINYFVKRGYRFISFSDILHNNISGDKNILLTIDDGNRSVYRAYREVLKPMNIKPLLAIYISVIGKKKYALNWEQLRELSSDGCEIAAHGFYHRKMNQRLYNKDRRSYLNEIYKPKSILEKRLKKKVRVFVYPYGLYIKDIFQHLKRAGYGYAFTVNGKSLSLPISDLKNPYEIPRYLITSGNRRIAFSGIIRSSTDKQYRISAKVKERENVKVRSEVKLISTDHTQKRKIPLTKNIKYDDNRASKTAVERPKIKKRERLDNSNYITALYAKKNRLKSNINSKDSSDEGKTERRRLGVLSYNFSGDRSFGWWRYQKRGKIHYRVKEESSNLSGSLMKEKSPAGNSSLGGRKVVSISAESYGPPVVYKYSKKYHERIDNKRSRIKERGNNLMELSIRRYHALMKMIREKTDRLVLSDK